MGTHVFACPTEIFTGPILDFRVDEIVIEKACGVLLCVNTGMEDL